MERLTIEKAGSILVNDLSGGYTSPCFGCESLGNCVSKKIQPCAIYRALEKLKKYEDLEEQNVSSGYSKWIECVDRLPDKSGSYLVTTYSNGISQHISDIDQFVYNGMPNGYWLNAKDVIAWQPLPEPYRP